MHWIVFFIANRCICAYDFRHTYAEEYENTIDLLAKEYNYNKKDIQAFVCKKQNGQYEKLNKVIGEKNGVLLVCSI